MSGRGQRTAKLVGGAGLCLAALLLAFSSDPVCAQTATATADKGIAQAQASAPDSGGGARVTLDRVAAVVNGDLVLESDVDAERRFAAFQPFNEARPVTRDRVIERLIDRELILQQMALQPQTPVSDAEVDAQLSTLRKTIPQCTAFQCQTDAGWEKFAEAHGYAVTEVRERWRSRMAVLRYIEERFRTGVSITQAEIDDYYQKTMLPVYVKEKVTPPAEASIAPRIQEILLQQQVDKLLEDWLAALRAQGSVVVMNPGEGAP